MRVASCDGDIRAPLLHALRPQASWLREECHLCTGGRVDVAALVGGELRGYEVKSARDTLRRLAPPHGFQVFEFSRVFDRVTLVCAPRHAAGCEAAAPPWWGVTVARGDELVEARPALLNPDPAPGRLARVLWTGELRDLARRLGLPTRRRDKHGLAGLLGPEHEAAVREELARVLPARLWRASERRRPRDV